MTPRGLTPRRNNEGPEAGSDDSQRTEEVVELFNISGDGDFVLVCEHASKFIPADMDQLGLAEDLLCSHIAWDPGALAVAQEMAIRLDSPLVAQRVSRLVYDCNRDRNAPDAIPQSSENNPIPGNQRLSKAERRARQDRYYQPFHDALGGCIDQRLAAGTRPAILTIHSFTPVYLGVNRPFDLGILHDEDSRFADAFLDLDSHGLAVRRNEPYGPQDGVTHTLRAHGLARGLPNIMIEIRNTLIADAQTQQDMAVRLSALVIKARTLLSDRSDNAESAKDTTP